MNISITSIISPNSSNNAFFLRVTTITIIHIQQQPLLPMHINKRLHRQTVALFSRINNPHNKWQQQLHNCVGVRAYPVGRFNTVGA